MSQHIHVHHSGDINRIVEELKNLLTERRNGKLVHSLQSVSVVNTYVPFTSAAGYMTIVLCTHLEHETAVEIVQELAESAAEPPTREQEVPDGE